MAVSEEKFRSVPEGGGGDLPAVRDSETTIKIKFSIFEGGAKGAERKIVQNAVFRGKRHDNKILKVQILLSKNLFVVAQSPKQPLSLPESAQALAGKASRGAKKNIPAASKYAGNPFEQENFGQP